MSGTQTTESKSSSEPLPEVYDILKRIGIPNIESMFNKPLEFFPRSTVAPRGALTTGAEEMAQGLGTQDYRQNANKFYGDLMGGKYLTENNPYLSDLLDTVGSKTTEQYQRSTAPSTMSRFARSGRSWSDASGKATDTNERNLAEGMQRANAGILKGDFDTRFAQMVQGLQMAPQFQGMDIADIQAKSGVGALQDQYTQRLLGDEMARFDFAQNEPEMRLDRLLQRLGQATAGFGTNTSTSTVPDNTGAAVGLGLLGAASSLGGAYMMGPMAAAADKANMMDVFANF